MSRCGWRYGNVETCRKARGTFSAPRKAVVCGGRAATVKMYVKDEDLKLSRKVYQHITVFEEVGHGACASAPEDVEELLSVDMGCVGEGLECTDRQVSICVKDGHGPYHYDVVKGLIQAAKDNHIDYAADVYPYYGSDADAALSAGIDARHGLIGPGVYASHGYERSHKDAVAATLELLKAYLA